MTSTLYARNKIRRYMIRGKSRIKTAYREISETLKTHSHVVLVDYRGLTVAEDTQIRKQLREAGVIYKVYKNTLIKSI